MISLHRHTRGTLLTMVIAILALTLTTAFAIGNVGVTASAGMTF